MRTLLKSRALLADSSRPHNPFIDYTAVESDGCGGDVSSAASSPGVTEVPCTPNKGFQLYFLTAATAVKASTRKPPRIPLRHKPANTLSVTKFIVNQTHSLVKVIGLDIRPSIKSVNSSVSLNINPVEKSVGTSIVQPVVKPTDCDVCGLTVNGPRQLLRHRNTKKCIIRSKQPKSN